MDQPITLLPQAEKLDINEILKKDLEDCSADELRLRARHLEEKIANVTASINNKGPQDVPIQPDDIVEIDMPPYPTGEVFRINEVPYQGICHVKYRTALQLAHMVSEAYKIERERLVSRKSILESASLRGEDLTKIRRFEQIMGDS